MSDPISESGLLTNLWREYVSPVVEKVQDAVQDWHCEQNPQDETCQPARAEPEIIKPILIEEQVFVREIEFNIEDLYYENRKSSTFWKIEEFKLPVMCLFCSPDTSRLKAPSKSIKGPDKP